MRVLVAYASRHGATAGIADRIGAALTQAGVDVDVKPIADARVIARASQLGRYDGFVIGSAIYAFHLLGEAKDFVRHNADVLRSRPATRVRIATLPSSTIARNGVGSPSCIKGAFFPASTMVAS